MTSSTDKSTRVRPAKPASSGAGEHPFIAEAREILRGRVRQILTELFAIDDDCDDPDEALNLIASYEFRILPDGHLHAAACVRARWRYFEEHGKFDTSKIRARRLAEEKSKTAEPSAKPKQKRTRKTTSAKKPEAPPENPAFRFDPAAINGDALLWDVHRFISRFVVYPSRHDVVAHALWIAHAHRMDAWDNTPRLLFTSYQPGSGKSRCLEVTALLVPRPMEAFNVSAAYLVRKVAGSSTLPTILYDEIDALFGAGKASERSEDVRAVINAGHRQGAKIGRCRVGEDGVETEELPAYCAVALAGLDKNLPDTITSRSIIIKVRRRAPHERVEAFRRRIVGPQAKILNDGLAAWTQMVQIGRYPEMPEGVTDREADVWEALIAIADVADGEWPKLARDAARYFVEQRANVRPTLGIQLLRDVKVVFEATTNCGQAVDAMASEQLATALVAMEEAPWGDLKGRALDKRSLASFLRNFDVQSENLRIGERVLKGYRKGAFSDAWQRYLTGIEGEVSATAATPLQST